MVVTPVSARGLKVMRDMCTGYAVYTPEYGVIFKVSDIFCRDYDTTTGEYLSEALPGRLIISDGDQYIHITPEVLQNYFEDLGDEGVIQFSDIEK